MARVFGCDVRTVRRHQRRFEDDGLAALGRPRGFPRGRPRVAQGRKEAVNQWKAEGVSNREIARRLGIDEKAVRKLAKRLGWVERPAEQMTVPFEDADPKLSASEKQQAGAVAHIHDRRLGGYFPIGIGPRKTMVSSSPAGVKALNVWPSLVLFAMYS